MPSLNDSLSALSEYSAQIHALSASNQAPAGQYTTALLNSLHLNPAASSSASSSSTARSKRPRGARSAPSAGQAGVLSLIRDATPSETRLFRFIGETEVAGVGRVKRVEKRDNAAAAAGLDVDLDEVEGVGGAGKGRDEVEVMLRTALRLVDDYRPMPRARATITSLLDTHHAQLERVAELELQIEEATNTQANAAITAKAANNSSDGASAGAASAGMRNAPAKLSFEDAVKAEEAALRAMEARLGPLRRARQAISQATSASRDPSPEKGGDQRASAFTASSTLPSSPPPVPAQSLSHSQSQRTPAKTPSGQKITNSLVNGTTPRRARQDFGDSGLDFDRFSPLKFLGTPRARAKTRPPMSALRGEVGADIEADDGTVGRGIFARRTTGQGEDLALDAIRAGPEPTDEAQSPPKSPPKSSLPDVDAGSQGDEQVDEDQTVRYNADPSLQDTGELHEAGSKDNTQDIADDDGAATPVPQTQEPQAPPEPTGLVCGCEVDSATVQHGVAKILDTMSDLLRQGLADGAAAPDSVESVITHLNRLSRSDPDPPPSPSSHSTSTLSSLPSNPSNPGSAAPKGAPIIPQTIITAHLLLSLLRAPDCTLVMDDLKDHLGATVRARGWADDGLAAGAAAGGLGTKYIYAAVGKRVIKIDRKNGAKVSFA